MPMMMPQQPIGLPTPAAGYRIQALNANAAPAVPEVPIYDRWLDYWLGQRNTDMYKNDASYRKLVEDNIAKYSALAQGGSDGSSQN